MKCSHSLLENLDIALQAEESSKVETKYQIEERERRYEPFEDLERTMMI